MIERVGFEGVFVLTSWKKGVQEYSNGVAKITIATKNGAKGINLLKGTFTEFENTMNSITRVMRYGAQIYGATVTKYYNLAMAVKKYSDISGMAYEDTSRLVEVTGDLGIDMGSVATAFRMMSNKGIAPTIESLMEISDKYLSLSTAQERNKYANDVLGKSYQSLIPLLELGRNKIQQLTDGVGSAQTITKEGIASALAYRDAMNEWNDTVDSLSNTIGSKLIPKGTALLTLFTDISNVKWDTSNWFGDMSDKAAKFINTAFPTLQKAYMEEGQAIAKENEARFLSNKYLGTHYEMLKQAPPIIAGVTAEMDELGNVTGELPKEIDAITYSLMALGATQIGTKQIEALNAALAAGTITQDEYTAAAVPIMKNQIGMTNNAIALSMAVAKIDKKFKDGKITLKEYNEKMTSISNTTKIAGDRGNMAADGVEELGDSIYEAKWAAMSAYPSIADLSALFHNKQITWSLLIKVSGGDFTHDQMEDLIGEVPELTPDPQYFHPGTMASGGAFGANKAMIVGERGAELIFPGSAGQVISNQQILSALAGINNTMPLLSRGASPMMGMGGTGGSITNNNNWNFKLNTMSGANVIQRSARMAQLLAG